MKWLVVLVALFLCLLPCPARGEELTSGISEALDKLELEQLGEEDVYKRQMPWTWTWTTPRTFW